MKLKCMLGFLLLGAATLHAADPVLDFARPGNSNPILPGYFADPSLLQHDGHFYLYATVDPWGDKTLGCWDSTDFKHWTYDVLNWPTKAACTSPTSKPTKVWAPSVVEKDGNFYMYVSCGSEVWAGTAKNPLGPWHSMLPAHTPLIPATFNTTYHMIDQECFLDDDGSAYLYWGSGWHYKNGHCFVVKLKQDMHTFDGEPKDVTPRDYFEAPFMMKRHGTYYLMYSDGNTTKDTYQVRYSMGKSPWGPFKEPATSPILKTDITRDVISPGHHAMFRFRGQDYILYHRAGIPFVKNSVLRQVCVDAISYAADGEINVVTPTHDGARAIQQSLGAKDEEFPVTAVRASSTAGEDFSAERAIDHNFATRWMPSSKEQGPHWLQLDLGEPKTLSRVKVLPEFPTHRYRFTVEVSDDGKQWKPFGDCRKNGMAGSPLVIEAAGHGRFVRVSFEGKDVSVWEIGAE